MPGPRSNASAVRTAVVTPIVTAYLWRNLLGPDGAGKSTVAEALLRAAWRGKTAPVEAPSELARAVAGGSGSRGES